MSGNQGEKPQQPSPDNDFKERIVELEEKFEKLTQLSSFKEKIEDRIKFRDMIWNLEYKIRANNFTYLIVLVGATWTLVNSKMFKTTSSILLLVYVFSFIAITVSFFMRYLDVAALKCWLDKARTENTFVKPTSSHKYSRHICLGGWVEGAASVLAVACFILGGIYSYTSGSKDDSLPKFKVEINGIDGPAGKKGSIGEKGSTGDKILLKNGSKVNN